MGWTGIMNVPTDRKAYMRAQYEGEHYAILKDAMVGSVYYAAVKHLRPERNGHVFGLIVLTSVKGRGYDREFMYKDMDENMGPNEAQCPVGILDLLSPLDDKSDPSGWGRNWRQKCRENALLKSKGNGNKLVEGETYWLGQAINFSDGVKRNGFTVRRVMRRGKNTVYFMSQDGYRVSLRGAVRGALLTRAQYDTLQAKIVEESRDAVVEDFMEIAA